MFSFPYTYTGGCVANTSKKAKPKTGKLHGYVDSLETRLSEKMYVNGNFTKKY